MVDSVYGWNTTTTSTTTQAPTTPTTTTKPPVPTGVVVKGNRFNLKGKTWVPVMDTAWNMVYTISSKSSDLSYYLDQRKAQGFNTIQFAIAGDTFNKSVTKPDSTLWKRITLILTELRKRGMFALAVPGIGAW